MTLIETVEEISNGMDTKEFAVGLFIDLQKAFDKVNHSVLSKKIR